MENHIVNKMEHEMKTGIRRTGFGDYERVAKSLWFWLEVSKHALIHAGRLQKNTLLKGTAVKQVCEFPNAAGTLLAATPWNPAPSNTRFRAEGSKKIQRNEK